MAGVGAVIEVAAVAVVAGLNAPVGHAVAADAHLAHRRVHGAVRVAADASIGSGEERTAAVVGSTVAAAVALLAAIADGVAAGGAAAAGTG